MRLAAAAEGLFVVNARTPAGGASGRFTLRSLVSRYVLATRKAGPVTVGEKRSPSVNACPYLGGEAGGSEPCVAMKNWVVPSRVAPVFNCQRAVIA